MRGVIVGSDLGDLAVHVETNDETAFVIELLACSPNQQNPSVIQQSKRESTTSKACTNYKHERYGTNLLLLFPMATTFTHAQEDSPPQITRTISSLFDFEKSVMSAIWAK